MDILFDDYLIRCPQNYKFKFSSQYVKLFPRAPDLILERDAFSRLFDLVPVLVVVVGAEVLVVVVIAKFKGFKILGF